MAYFNNEEIADILEYLQSMKSICSEAERYWYGLESDRVEYINRKLQDHLSVLEGVVACCECAREARELTRAIRKRQPYICTLHYLPNLVPRAMPIDRLGCHWLWGNGMRCL